METRRSQEVEKSELCPHGHSPLVCRECTLQGLLPAVEAKQFLSTADVELSERDSILLEGADWLVNPDYVSGAGIFVTGDFNQQRERALAGKLVAGLEAGGAQVEVLSADDLLLNPSARGVVSRVLEIGATTGVRSADGSPRALVITGFTQSEHVTKDGLASYNLLLDEPERKAFERQLADLRATPHKRKFLDKLPPAEAERLAAGLLAARYIDGSWQALATRKNGPGENLITITVAPQEVFAAILKYETGTVDPVGGQSDFLLRMQEFMENYK